MTVLRSIYDAGARSIELELDVDEPLPPATRLALTSIVQLAPGPGSSAVLVRQLASYHELEPREPGQLEPGDRWTIAELTLSHRPRHANDGPVSAFLILPDATTVPVSVEPMRSTASRVRVSDPRPAGPASLTPGDASGLLVVPHPAVVTITDAADSGVSTARLEQAGGVARAAWDAIAALEARAGASRLTGDGVGRVSVTLDDEIDPEGYRVSVAGDDITVAASGASGCRHAFTTLSLWLAGGLPASAAIEDRPAYAFRGLHVDLARHWFEADVVERLIDLAAWRKLSHLHLHLSDDEGWRLPIDTMPELAAIGGVRGHGLPLPPMLGDGPDPIGRAYTPDEIGRWVARAGELGVVLVPEVDLPAHAHASLTAMPALRDPNDDSGAISVQYFVDNVLVPGHPETQPFVEAVIDAVAALFPTSPVIHIGGDEVPEGAWQRSPIVAELVSERSLSGVSDVEAAFHRDLVATIRDRTGRRVGAWQEAAEAGGVEPGDGYVIGWRTVEASRDLAAKGYDVVVSPGQAYYLDMAVDDDWTTPGASWAGSTSLDDVCAFDPAAGWSDDERAHLLGIQACLWTEHVPNEATLHQRLFPRLDAIAERAWTGTIRGGRRSLEHRAAVITR